MLRLMVTGEGTGRAQALATQLASRLDGTARELPTDDRPGDTWAVLLPDGRAPLLVRDFGHGVTISGERAWFDGDDATLDAIAAETRRWAASTAPTLVTLVELALLATAALTDAFGEPWTASLPGVAIPTECWLHGRDEHAASIGLFPRGADRPRIVAALPQLVDYVRAQHAAYAENRARAARAEAAATALVARVPGLTSSRLGFTSHAGPAVLSLSADGREIAQLTDAPADLDAAVAQLEALIAHNRVALTLDKLTPGRRYRVLASLQELQRDTVVTFIGFDDIDNHYGRYEFRTDDGRVVAVSGDFSRASHSPLADTARYLVPV